MSRIEWYRSANRALGTGNLVSLQLAKYAGQLGIELKVGSPHLVHPVVVRPGTSDKQVFEQIFIGREYRCLDDLEDLDLIIDGGANVGYSSAYFLSRYPRAYVYAVEPDAGNFRQLVRNVRPYGESRYRLFQGAVWHEPTTLRFDSATTGRGFEWGRRVEAGDGADVEAIDIGTILRDSGFPRISLLKLDVEGAEEQIFAHGPEEWLPLVDNIVIELHGPAAQRVFFDAVAPYGFAISTCDELTVCRRRA
jgi:FkbM family methyltransferase